MNDTWDNALLAPTAPEPKSGSWDSAPYAPTAQAKAVVSVNDNADEAAQAIKIGKKTGISPVVVQTDIPGYDAHAKTQDAIKAVQNPAIAKYVDDNRMASQVSNDDYSTLDKISGVFTKLSQGAIADGVTLNLAKQTPIGELAATDPGRDKIRQLSSLYLDKLRDNPIGRVISVIGKGASDSYDPLPQREKDNLVSMIGKQGAQEAADAYALIQGVKSIFAAGMSGIGQFGKEIGLPDLEKFVGALAEAFPTGHVSGMGPLIPKPPRLAFPETHQYLAEHTPGGPRAKSLSAGETPDGQLWQAKPIIDQAKAEVAGDALDEAVSASAESKTKERSPELYEKYLEAHGDQGTVHVPAQAILDLYEREGKIPLDGDGLFGFVPGLADKATLAAETGAEIKIPLSKYVAHVDEAVHEGLKDQIRVQEDGVTREEAKAQVEEQKAKIEAYHGTPHDFENFDLSKIGTGEGAQVYGNGLYFAESKGVGTQYQATLARDGKITLKNGSVDYFPHSVSERLNLQAPVSHVFENALGQLVDGKTIPEAIKYIREQYADIGEPVLQEVERLLNTHQPVASNGGNLYKVHINADPTHFLDWDRPLSDQDPHVQEALKKITNEHKLPETWRNADFSGADFYNDLQAFHSGKDLSKTLAVSREAASKALAEAGIPGIKYLDQGSRPFDGKTLEELNEAIKQSKEDLAKETDPDAKKYFEGELEVLEKNKKAVESPTRNFVVFDDKLVKIVEKNDNPVVQAAVERTVAEKQSLYLEPLFKNGEAIGITQPEFKRYSDLIDRGQEAVLAKAVGLAKREAAKRLTPEWRANEERIRQSVDGLMYNRPDFAADRFFNQGIQQDGTKVPPELRVKLDDIKFKADADDYAPLFGFDNGLDMVNAVAKLEQERADTGKGPKWQFNKHVDAETAKQMELTYGKLADNIAIEASEAALAEHNVDLLSTEVKMLAKLNGREPPLNRTELTSWVKNQFDKSTASDISYEQWRRASEKGGREAEKALLKGDFDEAFITKQRQLLAFMLAREAKDFAKDVGRAEKLFDKYASEVNIPAVDQRYTDQIHRLMQQYGLDTKRTQENTDYNLQGPDNDFANFVRDRNANGDKIVQADLPVPRAGQNSRPIDNFTVDQFRDFATMIKSLDHNGRAAKQIELAGKKEAFNEVIDKVAKNLDTLEKNNFDPDAKGLISGLRKLGRAVDSRLLKAEKLIDWIDKEDPLGAMNSSVLRGLVEGEQAKGDMITKLAGMAKDLPGDRAWGKALDDLSTNKELLDWETGKPMKLTNENKIAIALNYGNKSNRRVLLEGYKWTEPEVEAYLKRELTPMDKAMVDGLHGLFEPLAPLVEKATSSRAGVAVPLIEGSPFERMKGGYYPLIEDPRAKLLGQQVDTDLFQKTKFDPLPTANALKQRTGKVYPIDLTISQIHSRLSQTAHAVFMQDPVINANKVISEPIVREGIAKAFGPEYVQMLDKWIRDIADNGGSDIGFRDDAAVWLSRNLRQNVTVQLMGWKASTALIHGGSAGASSAYEMFKLHLPDENVAKAGVLAPARLVKEIANLGLGQFLPDAARRFFSSQSSVFDGIDFIQQNSGEMRNRQRNLQKDFGFQLDKITNSSLIDDAAKLRAIHQTYSMAMVAYLDQLTASPVWRGAYDHALVEKGLEHDDAVYVADKAVREAHGSASLVSRANIGRGEINKWLTIAYNGYWNHNYNKMREAGKEVGGYDDSLSNGQRVAIGAAFMTAMIVAPALVHHAVRGEESKTTGGAIASMMVSQFGGTIPLVNTLTYSMIHNRDPSISPLDEVLKSASNVVKDQMAANPKHTVKHAAQAVGYLTGLPPTNQAIDTFTFMNDVLHRRQDPKPVQEWARGVMTGSSQPKVRR